ncbi:Uu.00g101440.m01.CDS01 [Anthostomella pinea]|uniref:Uu.00g101440.m01.CDS01 n=1 Tax=Anthostomella pinea TaxID=933095 RepID=A0AAI8VD17_9PEZI|nr:Uu.00g101440.m01.CDS01 [Anthostomella pinea]
MNLSAFLLLPLGALATPTYGKAPIAKRYDNAVWAPGITGAAYDMCGTAAAEKVTDGFHSMFWDHGCQDILNWSYNNQGEWVLDRTTDPTDDDNYHVLATNGSCAFLVKNTEPTSVGNKDVTDILTFIKNRDSHLNDSPPIEEKGSFQGCQLNNTVDFWLRDSDF